MNWKQGYYVGWTIFWLIAICYMLYTFVQSFSMGEYSWVVTIISFLGVLVFIGSGIEVLLPLLEEAFTSKDTSKTKIANRINTVNDTVNYSKTTVKDTKTHSEDINGR